MLFCIILNRYERTNFDWQGMVKMDGYTAYPWVGKKRCVAGAKIAGE